ncbi:MAG: carbamoyl-phosphate synthase large subunit, partial [Alphaproteobacteria bacterium]
AKVAAKLAVGYTLDELENDITKATPASFEPTIDYIVTKIPRFAFEKFPDAEPVLTTSMKSVGEAMAIGRTFHESLQKALRSLETGLDGLNEVALAATSDDPLDAYRDALRVPTPERLLVAAEALRRGISAAEICSIAGYDPWFIARLEEIIAAEREIIAHGVPKDAAGWRKFKSMGFSDKRIAALAKTHADEVAIARRLAGVKPVYKRIDTCAAEFEAITPYMYSTYEAPSFGEPECESHPTDKKKIVILGGGPNRIGQGIEFDYCCCHAAFALSEAGYETIMVNCNPETVSTDYDTSDRLYFEPLTPEDVIELIEKEMTNGKVVGIIVQFGGQTPLKLAPALEAAGIPILGTSPDAIDLAEDRGRFQKLIHQLGLRQPANGIATSLHDVEKIAQQVGLPIVLRPSNVLGGRGMQIISEEAHLKAIASGSKAGRHAGAQVRELFEISAKEPALIDRYLMDAIEVDVDAICDGERVVIAGIMEHIEEAGVHSGDSACSLPPYSLAKEIITEIERATESLARALKVVGLMNVQFAVQNHDVYVLEVNPRASRTVPFVAKATGVPVAKIAARVMAGEKLDKLWKQPQAAPHIAVKEAVFPFARFPGVDTVLGPEMRSTGEVMGIDRSFARAFAKSQLGGGTVLPTGGKVFLSVKDRDKSAIIEPARCLLAEGFKLVATRGTAKFLVDQGLAVEEINKAHEGRPNIIDAMKNGDITLVFNTTEGARALADSFELRRTALVSKIPYYTTVAGARAAVRAIEEVKAGQLEVEPLQSYS